MNAAFVSAASVAPLRLTANPAKTARRTAPTMTLRKQAARLASIPATLATIAPVLASEGTGEGLGIDTPLLYLPLILIPAVFFALFIPFTRTQNNEDFTGEYDERRN